MLRKIGNKLIIMVILLANVLMLCTSTVNADSGPKPTLTIYVENYKSQNYYLDLLGKEGKYQYFDVSGGNEEYASLHDTPIYKYNKDGWKAIHMRTTVLCGNLVGKYDSKTGKMVHEFSYVGVPNKFKIIIQKEDGSLLVSEVINNNYFNSIVYYDMSKNTFTIQGYRQGIFGVTKNSILPNNFITRCLFTILIELMLGIYLFKIKNWKVIILANFITQVILNYALGVMGSYAYIGFVVYYIFLEILIVIFEYVIYMALIKNIRKRKLFLFSVTSNLITFLLGILLF